MFPKKLALWACALAFLGTTFACSQAAKGVKLGEQAVTRGDYYAAAIEYLNVLRTTPKYNKAIDGLSRISKSAYEQKLKMAEGFQEQGNLEEALAEYKALSTYITQLRQYNLLNFVPVDIDKAISTVSSGAAEKHYVQAEALFKQRAYQNAIGEYRAALALVISYKDCKEKIAESFYSLAADLEKKNSYRAAAKNFENADAEVRSYKDATQKAAVLYYALGSYFLSQGQYRKAFEDLTQAKLLSPQYRDVNNKLETAREKSAVKIAFVRFDNPTGKDIAGMALGDFIFETIKSNVQSKASQFLRLLDREELLVLAREQRINEGLLSDESTVPMKLEGVNYLIFGKLNQVRDVRPGLSETQAKDYYEYYYEVPYVDNKGRQRTRQESSKAEMYFSLFKDKLSLTLSGVIKVIEVKTGRLIINHQISEEAGDEIEYADKFRAVHDLNANNIALPEPIKKLRRARRELKDDGVLAKEMIGSIARTMADKILSNLDVTPYVNDPAILKF